MCMKLDNLLDEEVEEDLYVPSRVGTTQSSRSTISLHTVLIHVAILIMKAQEDKVVPFVLDSSIDYDNIQFTPKYSADDLRSSRGEPCR